MPRLLVAPLSSLPDTLAAHAPSHLVSLLSPEHMIQTPPGFTADRHLKLGVNDIVDPAAGTAPPLRAHMDQLLAFARSWDASAPMVIHCWAGISRSTAAAFTTICALNPTRDEHDIAQAIRKASVTAQPNSRIVRFADQVLGRNGRMVEAVKALSPSVPAEQALPFRLELA